VNNCGACGGSCGFGGTCSAGKCACATGLATCGGSCVDLSSDPAHCGACSQACGGASAFCSTSAGATICAASCGTGQTACGNSCVDLASDPFHCGACGRFCGSSERCINQQCLADLYLACGDTNQIAEATAELAPAGTTHTVGTRPVSLGWLGNRLYSADSIGASISELRFDLPAPDAVGIARTLKIDATSASPDLEFVASGADLLYVSNSALANLDIVDAASGVVIAATHLDPAGTDVFTGPAGIALANGKAYVALNGADAIAVVNVSQCQAAPPACGPGSDCSTHPATACVNGLCVPSLCGRLEKRIALPASLASTPSGPTPYRLQQVGSRMYVTLQNLDRSTNFAPAGEGRLAVVDLATDTLVEGASGPLAVSLPAPCQNPGELVADGDTLYVACGFFDFFGTKATLGKAIVTVSLATGTPVPQAAIATQDVLSPIASCGGAIYAGATDTGTVVRYDPATGQLTRTALCPPDSNGNAFVADLTCRPGL
jgi:DNA-binding beta-propeller fold protein YncE